MGDVRCGLAPVLTLGALSWSAAVLVAPLAFTSHSPVLAGAAALFYQSAGLVCHQRPERSFHLLGVQLPVCARCAGLYWSAAAGAIVAWLARPRSAHADRLRIVLGLAALPTALTVGIEFAGIAYPSNLVRALSALPLGAAGAWVFISSLRSEASGTD